REVLGTNAELEETLFHSEDSSTLNTSFIERHNLTIRQGSAYLGRRTPCHARRTEFLVGHMALVTTYYNFAQQHLPEEAPMD
ncbi:IS1 family transposase, partial [Acidobacteria bacterium AH-259-A15]|nr:IS1 family transposase [Acidobacteria bacterium AH-259-A15]